MKILFLHQNFPGQFKYLAPALANLQHEVRALTLQNISFVDWMGVKVTGYKIECEAVNNQNKYLIDLEKKLVRAEFCLKACLAMKNHGFYPDIVIAHPGWGESILIKECWPKTKLGIYCEYFYNIQNQDVNFDFEFENDEENLSTKLRIKNINNYLNMDIADKGISPTNWQKNTFPKFYRENIEVIHDGINSEICKPKKNNTLVLKKNGIENTLVKGDQIITFVNRNLEPYRGFHVFMRAIPIILEKNPNAKILIVGGFGVSYGFFPSVEKYGYDNWKDLLVSEITGKISPELWGNIFFLGNIDYQKYLVVLQLSMIHVYLTYPFVLSWSLLEAMSVGCAVIASDTEPVKEIISDGINGELVNFFKHEILAEKINDLLKDEEKRKYFGENAREKIITNYDLNKICLPKQIKWVEELNG
jgi:glycosyltransferase involved in cell wall biosynthesis